ncbi:MAG: hypothetical protein CVU22_15015 [Betaproteobacteria bacterium HGW-Betaproteobacteria-16]|nr:MAG: hypothetical protein CVU22_15015 [Betaproteobacteria bacterium HGW-Betaproteobacteria-16]
MPLSTCAIKVASTGITSPMCVVWLQRLSQESTVWLVTMKSALPGTLGGAGRQFMTDSCSPVLRMKGATGRSIGAA